MTIGRPLLCMIMLLCLGRVTQATVPDSLEAILQASATSGEPEKQIQALNKLGALYMNSGDHTRAIDYHLQALRQATDTGKPKLIFASQSHIGNVYVRRQDYLSAEKHYRSALAAAAESESPLLKSKALNNLGITMLHSGKPEEAIQEYQISLSLAREAESLPAQALAYGNLGIAQKRLGRYEEALANYQASLGIEESLGDRAGMAETEVNIGALYEAQGEIEAAIGHYHRGLTMADSAGARHVQLAAFGNLASAYERKRNASASLFYLKEHLNLRDTLRSEASVRDIAQLQAAFELDKKEQELILSQERAAQQRTILIGAGAGLLMIALLSFLLYKRRQDKQQHTRVLERIALEKQLAEFEGQALRLQMNPHFIFNALTSIGGFIYENEPAAANRYLGKFARLMRITLESSGKTGILLEKELEALKLYVELEQLRHEGKFEAEFELAPELSMQLLIPPMLIQPCVENAILHGLGPKSGTGKLHIHLQSKDGQLRCSVRDDGVGRKAVAAEPDGRRHALEITQRRLQLLTGPQSAALSLQVIDHKDAEGIASGTEVILKIPIGSDSSRNVS